VTGSEPIAASAALLSMPTARRLRWMRLSLARLAIVGAQAAKRTIGRNGRRDFCFTARRSAHLYQRRQPTVGA
jgi:hypothetical protein